MSALDPELIREAAACASLAVETVDETASTNRVLMDAPFGRAPGAPRLLAAAHQTAGRGRRGRAWLSPQGRSVAFSISLERRVLTEPPPTAVAVVVGTAVAGVLSRWAPDVQLKWPNDIQRGGRKLAGILVESRRSAPAAGAHGDTIERIVVGIGVNLLAPPQACAIGQPACGLIDGEMLPARIAETVIGALAGAVVPAVERFLAEGLAPFVAAWRRFDALDGRPVTLVDGERVLASGRALGLDDSGGLRVQTADGMRVLRNGEVSLRLRGAAD